MPSDTPILDLEQDPPFASLPPRHIVRATFGMLVAVALWTGPFAISALVPGAPQLNLFLWFPAIYVAIGFHEGGHLVANRIAGIHECDINAGGLSMAKSGGRWHFRLNPTGFFVCTFNPIPENASSPPGRVGWSIAAGPLASLLLSALCGLCWLKFGGGAYDWISTLFWGAAFPLTSLQDGFVLWQYLRHPHRVAYLQAASLIRAQDARGILPRDWDPALMEMMLNPDDLKLRSTYFAMLAFIRSDDQRDDAAACLHLERALSSMAPNESPQVRRWGYLASAAVSALVRKNPAQARVWLERAVKVGPSKEPESADVAEAAIAMAEGRYRDALRHFAAAREFMMRKHLDSGAARAAKEQIAELEEKCRAAMREAADNDAPDDSVKNPEPPRQRPPEPFPWMSAAVAAIVVLIIVWAALHR